MSALIDELLQSHLLDDDDEEADEGWLDVQPDNQSIDISAARRPEEHHDRSADGCDFGATKYRRLKQRRCAIG
jgi:hypothetical protein